MGAGTGMVKPRYSKEDSLFEQCSIGGGRGRITRGSTHGGGGGGVKNRLVRLMKKERLRMHHPSSCITQKADRKLLFHY